MEEEIIDSAINILQPVMESALVLAGDYTKACGRKTLTSMDLKYAMRYCAMTMVGKHTGSLFPEIYEESSDEDEDDFETVEESEDDFVRYEGDNEFYIKVNESFDRWDSWVPTNPAEKMLKEAIDKQD